MTNNILRVDIWKPLTQQVVSFWTDLASRKVIRCVADGKELDIASPRARLEPPRAPTLEWKDGPSRPGSKESDVANPREPLGPTLWPTTLDDFLRPPPKKESKPTQNR